MKRISKGSFLHACIFGNTGIQNVHKQLQVRSDSHSVDQIMQSNLPHTHLQRQCVKLNCIFLSIPYQLKWALNIHQIPNSLFVIFNIIHHLTLLLPYLLLLFTSNVMSH